MVTEKKLQMVECSLVKKKKNGILVRLKSGEEKKVLFSKRTAIIKTVLKSDFSKLKEERASLDHLEEGDDLIYEDNGVDERSALVKKVIVD